MTTGVERPLAKAANHSKVEAPDYHYEPEARKKKTIVEKCREDTARDLKEEEMRKIKNWVKVYYVMTVLGTVLNLIAIVTVFWYAHVEEQRVLTAVTQKVLIRTVEFHMSYEGLKVFIGYCPEDGMVIDGSAACVTDKDSYESFDFKEFWAQQRGKKESSEYGPAAEQASSGAETMLAFMIINLLMNFLGAGVLTYGVCRKPHRRVFLCTFTSHVICGVSSIIALGMFHINTTPLRDLLRHDSYIPDTAPLMTASYSFFLTFCGTFVLLGAGFPFWRTVPRYDGTAEGAAAVELLFRERMARVKQYREDTVNTSHMVEAYTNAPKSKFAATFNETRVRPEPVQGPLKGLPAQVADFPLVRPGTALKSPQESTSVSAYAGRSLFQETEIQYAVVQITEGVSLSLPCPGTVKERGPRPGSPPTLAFTSFSRPGSPAGLQSPGSSAFSRPGTAATVFSHPGEAQFSRPGTAATMFSRPGTAGSFSRPPPELPPGAPEARPSMLLVPGEPLLSPVQREVGGVNRERPVSRSPTSQDTRFSAQPWHGVSRDRGALNNYNDLEIEGPKKKKTAAAVAIRGGPSL